MMSSIERGWPLVVAAAVALVAYFQARAVTQMTAAAIAVAPPPAPPMRRSPRPPRERVDATPILARNPFDSVTGPLDGRAVPEPAPTAPPPRSDPLSAPTCDFGYVTLIVDAEDAYAFAAIETKDGNSRLRRIGDRIDTHQIVDIAPRRVWLDGASTRCQMKLGDKVQVPKKRPAPRARRRRRVRRVAVPQSIANKVERVSATEFRIERSAIDEILEKQAELMRRTRVRPLKRGDEVVGMRVSRVLNGTLLDTIGIKTGDVIKSINGFSLTDPQKALEAYGRLRSASRLTVQLERRGKPVSVEYQIH